MNDRRYLLLHTDRDLRERMALRFATESSRLAPGHTVRLENRDGAHLDYLELLGVLKAHYDGIFLDLHLPALLSLRAAELAHLTCLPTRLVLMEDCRTDSASTSDNHVAQRIQSSQAAIPLFDAFLPTPINDESLASSLRALFQESFSCQRGSLPNQDHLDAAIEIFMGGCQHLVPGARGAAHAFGIYRDTYLHTSPATWEARVSAAQLSLEERLDRFARVRPLLFSSRLSQAAERISHSPYFAAEQRTFLKKRFEYLLDNTGRVLTRFRQEVEDILIGLEQFACMCESGPREEQMDITELAQLLMVRAQLVPGFEEGIAPIVYFLLHLKNVPTVSRVAESTAA